MIYSDNKSSLLEAASHSDERVSATELLRERGKENERLRGADRPAAPQRGQEREEQKETPHG